jgi:hypothetical protein
MMVNEGQQAPAISPWQLLTSVLVCAAVLQLRGSLDSRSFDWQNRAERAKELRASSAGVFRSCAGIAGALHLLQLMHDHLFGSSQWKQQRKLHHNQPLSLVMCRYPVWPCCQRLCGPTRQ